ncbi:MAG: nuclear transport factor 2 family protein [Thermoanaerobaculia bacterium]
MSKRMARSAVVVALALSLAPVAGLAEDAKGGPAEVAHQFLRAFEKKDWATVRSLFAPKAVVSTVSLSRQGAPEVAYLTAQEWAAQTEKELAPVTSIKLDVIDTSVLTFDQGATVSVRFHSAGKAGAQSFTNDGIDTYSMTTVNGAWRILRYGTFELLEFH